jgi:hypothetical protein
MPSRLLSLTILLFWVVAASSLIRRDILPEIGFVRPPDLRTIAKAEDQTEPARWSVEVIDNPLAPENRRPVGLATTSSTRDKEGWVLVSSMVSFDAGGLLKGTALRSKNDSLIEVDSSYRIDQSGNLRKLRIVVKSASDSEPLLTIDGQLKNHKIELVSHSKFKLKLLNDTKVLPYEPRSLVQNALGPFVRLPGLQVGQRWETRMVSPLTGLVEPVQVEVARKCVIHWDKNPVTTFEVIHHTSPLAAHTWVRTDGLILRQEVPFPFVKLILERLPDRTTVLSSEVPG